MSEFDYGPLAELMQDDQIFDIVVNHPQRVYAWHKDEGRQRKTEITFPNGEALRDYALKLAQAANQPMDARNPIAELRLPDGSWAMVIIAPVAPQGAIIRIGKPIRTKITRERLVEVNALSQPAAEFLTACVRARLNIGVLGGFNSGKTTLLNMLIDDVYPEASITVIQPVSALDISHENVAVLETRRPDLNGQGAITNRQLLYPAMELRTGRIVLAELDGSEGDALLDAMQLGYGVLFAMNAISPRDALSRLELSAIAANLSVPLLTIREQLADSLDILVHAELVEGLWLKRMVGITEVRGMRGDSIELGTVFERQRELDQLIPTGEVPQIAAKIRERGVEVDEAWFVR